MVCLFFLFGHGLLILPQSYIFSLKKKTFLPNFCKISRNRHKMPAGWGGFCMAPTFKIEVQYLEGDEVGVLHIILMIIAKFLC